MWRKIARRLVVAGLSLALASGLVVRSVQAFDMGLKAAVAATMDTDMPMPGKCDGCAGSEKSMTPSACAAFCGTVIALPTIAVVYDVGSVATMTFAGGPNTTGRTIPPDPHPPRPAYLS
jgi:hypothetical protein